MKILPKISIIIPVYNSEKYIEECMDSVLNQVFTDFEVLLINDGSTDKSRKICDEYSVQDTRIRVFHKVNGGVSSARNLGLEKSKGEWICFVDSDDWLSENYLLELWRTAVDAKVDLVIHGFKKIKEDQVYNKDLGQAKISSKDYDRLFQEKRIQNFGYPFAKFFKREIVVLNQIIFPENYTIAEDLTFLLLYLAKCQTIRFESAHNYYYRHTYNSLSNSLRIPEIYFNRYFGIRKTLKGNYDIVYSDIYRESQRFPALQHMLGSSLFQGVLSLYFFNLNRGERIKYLRTFDINDRYLISLYKTRFRNPVFRISLWLIESQRLIIADAFLYTFFLIRKIALAGIGKSIHYKFKK